MATEDFKTGVSVRFPRARTGPETGRGRRVSESREPGLHACRCDEGRREFLREAAAILAVVLPGLGLSAAEATAFPVRMRDALDSNQDEATYPIPDADGATIDRANQVILVRCLNKVYAFSLACPHENTALRWLPRENRFQCPRHQSKYQLDGVFMSGRATRNMDRLPIRRAGTNVVVGLATMYRSDKDKAAWDTAAVVL